MRDEEVFGSDRRDGSLYFAHRRHARRENDREIFSRDVLRRIKEKDPEWEKMVPTKVAEAIKRRGLFGFAGQGCGLIEIAERIGPTAAGYSRDVNRFTVPSRWCRHSCHRSRQEVPMRIYIEVVLTIIGLLGAYVALLPLMT